MTQAVTAKVGLPLKAVGHSRYLWVLAFFFSRGQGRGVAVTSTSENSVEWPGMKDILTLLNLDYSKFVSGKFKVGILETYQKGLGHQ